MLFIRSLQLENTCFLLQAPGSLLFLLIDMFWLCSTSLQVMFHTSLWLCEGLKIDFLKQIPEQRAKGLNAAATWPCVLLIWAHLLFLKHQTASNSVCNAHVLARMMVRCGMWTVGNKETKNSSLFSGNRRAWFDTKDKYYKVLYFIVGSAK